MEQHLSWRKAYILPAAIHVVIFLLLAIGLAAVVAKQEQQVYEIDLQASDFNQGSGHEGSGSSESLFPEPLKAEEVAKRVETVQQPMLPTTSPTDTASVPDEIALPSSAAPSPTDTGSTARGTTTGTSGTSTGTENSTEGEHGHDTGTEPQAGNSTGNVSGPGDAPFDTAGLRAAIDANKTYPPMAVKRSLTGTVTISIVVDASGNFTSVKIASSSGYKLLDEAGMAAAYAVGSYPNPTGKTVRATAPIVFDLD